MKPVWSFSGRRLRGQWWIFALVMSSASSLALAKGPETDVYVDNGHKFEKSEVLLSGSATDDHGIASVRVAVKDRSTKRWLKRDGKWGSKPVWHRANLSFPDGTTTPWLFRQSLPIGTYSVRVKATNLSGETQSADRPLRKVRVVKDRAKLDKGERWLTIQFGRSAWGAAGGGSCSPYTDPVNGSVFLDEIAAYLTERGYTAQGSVPFGHFDPDPAVRTCPWPGHISASLNDLAALREDHGWTFVADSIGSLPSNPSARPGMAQLSCKDQIASASASLAELQKFGHFRGWGLLASPAAGVSPGVRDNIQSRLFSFSRKYGYDYRTTENTEAKSLVGDWAYFKSVGGGLCNDPKAECYNHHVYGDYGVDPQNHRYNLPDALLGYAVAAPGAWRGIQFYRLVRGARVPVGYPGTSTSPAGTGRESYWDCTSPDPKLHWVSRPELYCFEDFKTIVERLYWDHPDVITTDTAHVATTWGVGNPNHYARYPVCRCQSDSDCDEGRTCQGGRCRKPTDGAD